MNIFLVKNFSIALAAITSLAQIAIFTRSLSIEDLAFLMFIFGVSNFAVFFDIASKPSYSILKKRFLTGDNWNEHLFDLIKFFFFQFIFFTSVFFLVVFSTSFLFAHSLNSAVIFLIVLSIGAIVMISALRVILASIDLYFYGEVIEMSRRLCFLLATIFILYEKTLIVTSLIMFLSTLILLIIMLRKIARICKKNFSSYFDYSFSKFKKTFQEIGMKGFNSLIVLGSDTLTYNLGYIIFGFSGNSQALIIFGIWQRLYLAISLLGQIIPDILVHKITTEFFKNSIQKARKLFFLSFTLSFLSVFLISLLFFIFKDPIFKYWTNGDFLVGDFLLLALSIWLISNVFQHSSGAFLAYHGKSFSLMRNISLSVSILIIIFASSFYIFSSNINYFLIVGGGIYFFGALIYFNNALKILRNSP